MDSCCPGCFDVPPKRTGHFAAVEDTVAEVLGNKNVQSLCDQRCIHTSVIQSACKVALAYTRCEAPRIKCSMKTTVTLCPELAQANLSKISFNPTLLGPILGSLPLCLDCQMFIPAKFTEQDFLDMRSDDCGCANASAPEGCKTHGPVFVRYNPNGDRSDVDGSNRKRDKLGGYVWRNHRRYFLSLFLRYLSELHFGTMDTDPPEELLEQLETNILTAFTGYKEMQAEKNKPPPYPPRFGVGEEVVCNTSMGWKRGTVVKLWYREPNFPDGKFAPYQVQLGGLPDSRSLIYVPVDTDNFCRRALVPGPGDRVRLHSLQTTELNGVSGVVCAVEDEDERAMLQEKGRLKVLLHPHKEIKTIKPANLEVISAPTTPGLCGMVDSLVRSAPEPMILDPAPLKRALKKQATIDMIQCYGCKGSEMHELIARPAAPAEGGGAGMVLLECMECLKKSVAQFPIDYEDPDAVMELIADVYMTAEQGSVAFVKMETALEKPPKTKSKSGRRK